MLFELLKLSCSESMIHFCMSKNNQLFKHEQPISVSHSVSKCIYYWDYKKTIFINPVMLYKLYKLTGLWGKIAKQKMNKMIFLKASWAVAWLHCLEVAFTCSVHSKITTVLSGIMKFSLSVLISLFYTF